MEPYPAGLGNRFGVDRNSRGGLETGWAETSTFPSPYFGQDACASFLDGLVCCLDCDSIAGVWIWAFIIKVLRISKPLRLALEGRAGGRPAWVPGLGLCQPQQPSGGHGL